MGSVVAGARLAAAYTLVQSCRALGIFTHDYLVDVSNKIAGGWPGGQRVELTPHNWVAARVLQTAPI